MPIYECHCLGCDLTFEVLAPLSQAGRRHPCPRCSRPAPRIASAFAIASDGESRESQTGAAAPKRPGAPEAPPLCLRYPHVPLLCHMDQKAAKRWLAHYNGRGAEYDDKQGAREELRKKRGLPPEPPPPPPTHSHDHGRNFRRHQIQGASEHGGEHHHPHVERHEHPRQGNQHEAGHPHSAEANGGPHEHVSPRGHTHALGGHAHGHRGHAHGH